MLAQRFFTQQRPVVASSRIRVQPRIVASVRGLSPLIDELKAAQAKQGLPDVQIGDTVRIGLLVQEAKSSRTQRVEGTIIAMAGSGSTKTMVVRRIFQGVGIEMSIMMHSPVLSSVEIVRRGKVRRAKLYYLRELTGKSARLKEVFVSKGDKAAKAAAAANAAKPCLCYPCLYWNRPQHLVPGVPAPAWAPTVQATSADAEPRLPPRATSDGACMPHGPHASSYAAGVPSAATAAAAAAVALAADERTAHGPRWRRAGGASGPPPTQALLAREDVAAVLPWFHRGGAPAEAPQPAGRGGAWMGAGPMAGDWGWAPFDEQATWRGIPRLRPSFNKAALEEFNMRQLESDQVFFHFGARVAIMQMSAATEMGDGSHTLGCDVCGESCRGAGACAGAGAEPSFWFTARVRRAACRTAPRGALVVPGPHEFEGAELCQRCMGVALKDAVGGVLLPP
ncbi:MAG: ribosomal protein L19-domain-containing protein [Monoraphidium minutum]|nr:MAG: ribosomal protein L19-domain-containing protein [Monoraphidium minutum]